MFRIVKDGSRQLLPVGRPSDRQQLDCLMLGDFCDAPMGICYEKIIGRLRLETFSFPEAQALLVLRRGDCRGGGS